MSDTTNPRLHCFREDNCIYHPDHPTSNRGCCCCGALAEDHEGCDCEDVTP